jgi:hypothetical protein
MTAQTKTKKQAPADPTGTRSIRSAYRAEAERRINMVRTILKIVVVDQDMFGLSMEKPGQSSYSDEYKLSMFNNWFNSVLYTHVVAQGQWGKNYLQAANDKGTRDAAHDLSEDTPWHYPSMSDLFTQEARTELEGIVDATLQQTTRAVSATLLYKASNHVMYSRVIERLAVITVVRVQALVNSMVVKVYNNAKLDYFKGNGLVLVGINAEAQMHKHTHDAVNRNLVQVLTAGDDDVCITCEDISDDGPYDIATARTLIPAHPNCRCAFVPFGDERFKPVHDAKPPTYVTIRDAAPVKKAATNNGKSQPNPSKKPDGKPLEPKIPGGDDWATKTGMRLNKEAQGSTVKITAALEALAEAGGSDSTPLAITRAAQILQDRGLASGAAAIKLATLLDKQLWDDWKQSAGSPGAQAIQLAVSEELGGRLRPDSLSTKAEDIKAFYNGPDYATNGRWEAVKAYVRAKWETTQYELSKAGTSKVEAYRAIQLDKDVANHPGETHGEYQKLPMVKVARNGAVSTTSDRDVANKWGDDGKRVVLRASVPSTAVLASHDNELVLIGTHWHGWDAWKGAAPSFEEVPLGTTISGSNMEKPKPVKLGDYNQGHEAKGSSKGGQFAKGHGPVGGSSAPQRQAPQSFVSPNIANLSFVQAEQSINSDRQKVFLKAANQVDTALGIKGAENRSVIGAWSDGAENSTLCTMPGADYETAKAAAAMKGHLADQKAVIVFQPDEGGENFMATFKATGDLEAIHDNLLKSGIENHTLEPEQGGATVHVFGFDQETLNKVSAASKQYGNSFDVIKGKGEFVGTEKQDGTDREQRDDARRVYEKVIADASRQLPGRNIASVWKSLRSDWSANLEEISRPDIRTSMAREPENPVLAMQPVKTVQELYLKCRAAEKSFQADIEDITSRTGGSSKYAFDPESGTTLKKLNSTLRKMRDETNNDPRMIRDVLRATVINDTVVESRKAAAEFIGQMGNRIIRVKDRFVLPSGSYRDLMINYRTENGMIAEVQFNTGKILEAKSKGHKLYEESRLLLGKIKRGEVDAAAATVEINRLNNASEQVYQGAYVASGNGNGWQKQLH